MKDKQVDLSQFGKDHLTTSLIPYDIAGNFAIKPVALSVNRNGNCLFNSFSRSFAEMNCAATA